MWPRFGIKIGNSTLCIAYTKADGKFDVIANKQGDRVSQACLLWDGISEIECGLTAKQKMATRQKQAVAHAFQLLHPQEDLKEEQIEAALKHIPCDYDAKAHTFELQCPQQNGESDSEAMATHQISPYDVHVALFKAELELARQFHSDNEQKPIVVLSVPSYYGAGARSLLAEAAEEAGFHVAQVVSEPTAAILAYKIGESADDAEGTSTSTATTTSPADKTAKRHVLTIKSGGLYSHFALYAVEDGLYTQLDAYGPFPIGGKQFTEALVQFICEEFQRKFKLDPHESRRSLAKIRSAAANCKHILSQMPSTQVYIDSLMDGVDFNAQMSRARFESLIQPVIGNFMQTLNECVEKALQQHKDVQKIDGIVLLGATMQIPKLRSAISTKYPDAELHATMSADEVVAVGCAIQAMYVPDPLGRELEATEECIFIEDEVTIWHGNDESQKVEVFKKGAMMPGKVQVNVPLAKDENANAEDANGNENVFNVRIGEQILKIQVSALTANGTAEKNDDEDDEEEENGSPAPLEMPRDATNCCLEAELESKEDATEAANTILRLRAL